MKKSVDEKYLGRYLKTNFPTPISGKSNCYWRKIVFQVEENDFFPIAENILQPTYRMKINFQPTVRMKTNFQARNLASDWKINWFFRLDLAKQPKKHQTEGVRKIIPLSVEAWSESNVCRNTMEPKVKEQNTDIISVVKVSNRWIVA